MYRCSECGKSRVEIEATQLVTAVVNADGEVIDTHEADTEWDDSSEAVCSYCGHTGFVSDFFVEALP